MHTTLIVPGLHGSGPTHWQSWFQQVEPDARRVEQVDWSTPDLSVWAERVLAEIDAARGRILIVAHSFGCLAAVTAAAARPDRIAGALLVAPADPRKFGVSAVLPASPLGYPGILVSSSNDPWVSSSTARYWAGRWGCRFVDVGAKGHINVESGFGPWPEGYELYELLAAADRRPGPRQRSAAASADDAPPDLPAAAPAYIPLYY
ncbi:alpha/beta fold hydrolase [Azoarcus sp. TTM-91]|uniref:RBBP9/YdeN family alpha/beta hydrolase n=1 Tax=Azoarcus sp. TTM-91 TaxID=2691581 RepID=UPI00145F38D1|nr:alpha/beta hydrolase [Azoarcus sp. TTM-91]NMG37226.1 alpha/beta fold hydrolase [Azoarcus sp. TTM-91]